MLFYSHNGSFFFIHLVMCGAFRLYVRLKFTSVARRDMPPSQERSRDVHTLQRFFQNPVFSYMCTGYIISTSIIGVDKK